MGRRVAPGKGLSCDLSAISASFVPSDESVVEHVRAPSALYDATTEGFAHVSVTNHGSHAIEFDQEDHVLGADAVRSEQCHHVSDSVYYSQLTADEQALATSISSIASPRSTMPCRSGTPFINKDDAVGQNHISMLEGGHRPSTGRERDSSSLVPEIPARGWS